MLARVHVRVDMLVYDCAVTGIVIGAGCTGTCTYASISMGE